MVVTFVLGFGAAWRHDFGSKDASTLNRSLPYLLAVALLDGDVMPAQFNPERIIKPDVQALLKKVSVRPNHEFTELYPGKMPAKIIVRLGDGRVIEQEVQDYPGLASYPFTWEDAVQKFHALVGGRIDEGLSVEIKDAVHSVENIQVRDLMELLGYVRQASSVWPARFVVPAR
jgi:2-methylcitrate dehydratase